MAQFPGPQDINVGVPQAGTTRMFLRAGVVDTSGLQQGIDTFAQNTRKVAGDIVQMAQEQKRQDNVVDIGNAEAYVTQQKVAMESKYANDTNYSTLVPRANKDLTDTYGSASQLIRDPLKRQEWISHNQAQMASDVGAYQHRADSLRDDHVLAQTLSTLENNAAIVIDPANSDANRQKAYSDIAGQIEMARKTGIISESRAVELKQTYLTKLQQQASLNNFKSDVDRASDNHDTAAVRRYSQVLGGTATADTLASAADAAYGPDLVIDKAAAGWFAKTSGDANFPINPQMQSAYVNADPETRQRYLAFQTKFLSDQLHGDTQAALVAMAPGGNLSTAQRFAKSGHDTSTLNPETRGFYDKVMAAANPTRASVHIPLQAEGNVDLSTIHVPVLAAYEKVQSDFGRALPVVEDHSRDAVGPAGDRGITVDISGVKGDDLKRLLKAASANGFSAINVNGHLLQLEADGPPQAMGFSPEHQDVVDTHVATGHPAADPIPATVAPRYQGLTFDQRQQAQTYADQKLKEAQLGDQSAIQTSVDNAAAAIKATGSYQGTIYSPNDFVAAYGSVDGVRRSQEYGAEIRVAHIIYNMHSMSAGETAAYVQSQLPVGDDASGAQAKAYAEVSKAGQDHLNELKDHPNAAAAAAFPELAQAQAALGANPDESAGPAGQGNVQVDPIRHYAMMSQIMQSALGVPLDKQELFPPDLVTHLAEVVNNPNLPLDERTGAIAQVYSRLSDDQQQAFIGQMQKAGVKYSIEAPLEALSRGDQASASKLFRAVMTDQQAIEANLPAQNKLTDLAQTMNDRHFGLNGDGSVYYGTGPNANNTRSYADRKAAVSLAGTFLLDGTAHSKEEAVDMAYKALVGPVSAITGGADTHMLGFKISVPDEEAAPIHDQSVAGIPYDKPNASIAVYASGFAAMRQQVKDALDTANSAEIASPRYDANGRQVPLSINQKVLTQTVAADDVQFKLDNGWFANGTKPDTYVFITPQTGRPLADPKTGREMLWTKDQIVTAGKARPVMSDRDAWKQRLGLGWSMW